MIKRYEDLCFTDDFLFCKVLQSNPDICKELTELILGRRIGRIVMPEAQKAVEITADGRGVRFDVYFEDDANTVYDIEMQNQSSDDLRRRSRYYQGMMDLNLIERGIPFSNLPESYIIFICPFDAFGKGRHKYSFENVCVESIETAASGVMPHMLHDGSHKIFLCAGGTEDDVSPQIRAFIDYIAGKLSSSDDFVQRLHSEVIRAREHREWRLDYMTFQEHVERAVAEARREARAEALAEGRAEGHAEGRAEGRVEEREEILELLKKKYSDNQDLLDELTNAIKNDARNEA